MSAPVQEPTHDEYDDPTEGIQKAIEEGCRAACAATGKSAEDFLRFAQGVEALARAWQTMETPIPDGSESTGEPQKPPGDQT